MEDYEICDEPGPCWNGYVYVGPAPRTKGSCIKKDKLCRKKRGKGVECKSKITCDNVKKTVSPIKKTKSKSQNEIDAYNNCLPEARERFNKGKLSLCPEGYCTAKHTFEVYPSAYANGYAASVCKGDKPDFNGDKSANEEYMVKLNKKKKSGKKDSLQRWFKEEWVNVCEKGDGPGGFAICGTGEGIDNPEEYPYCRAYHKLPGTTVVTAQELTQEEIDTMCARKKSLEQGIDGKPTRIMLPKDTRQRVKAERKAKGQSGGNIMIKIPQNVKDDALLGIKLLDLGFKGGTKTGWNRAEQLAYDEYIDLGSLADMRTWFARHGPDAENGGTSYPGFCKWIEDDMPMDRGFSKYRGAVSWLIWGGDAAYKWIKSKPVRSKIEAAFPKRKKSPLKNNLYC